MARKPSTRRLSLKDEALHPQATQQLPLGRPAQARVRKCELTFPDGIVSVVKGADNIWRCPRCKQEFGADARILKEHARSGACMARARGGAVRQRRASGVRLRIGPLRTGDSAGDIEFIARRTRSDGPDDEADEDAFDMNEVLMKLEEENENENYYGNGNGNGSGSGSGMDQDRAPGEAEQTVMAIDPLPGMAAEPARDERPGTPTPIQAARVASMGMQKIAAEAAGSADVMEQKASSEADGRATTTVTVDPMASTPDNPRGEGAAVGRSPRVRSVTAEATNTNAAAALILLASPSQAATIPNIPARPPATTPETPAPPMSTSIPPSSPTAVSLPSSPTTRISQTTHPTEYSTTVPPALRGFLDTLLATGDFLPEIFMQREFDSAVALDLLCESAQEEEYRWLIQAIQARSHLVSLAVKRGLREREAALRAARAAAASE